MCTVGIIANPASGRDIRRLVAHGSMFDNAEKVNIVRRALLGLEAVGVERVWIMPDSFGIGQKALDGLQLRLNVTILSMPVTFTPEDSTRASALMTQEHVGCIITLGGDGTNRVVAKASDDVPLMPISTGTNNVFPTMIEGTIAGMAAGLVSRGLANEAVCHMPRLDIFCEEPSQTSSRDARAVGAPDDIALVDVAVYDERFTAARAIWDVSKIKEVILTGVKPGHIGLSSIGAHVLDRNSLLEQGLYLRLEPGGGGQRVLAPIAPGLIREVSLAEYRLLAPGDQVSVSHRQPCVLALDGEREIELSPGTTVRLQLNFNGPRVIDVRKAIEVGARTGVFIREAPQLDKEKATDES
jgi:predicted polyphosphate/ATP-dependent NAD kinase